MSGKPDPVWEALGALHDSEVVRETHAYVAARVERRARLSAFREALTGLWPKAALASALAAVILFLLYPAEQTFASGIGEMRRITLSDGSTAMLNTGTTLRVRYGWFSRSVELAGEAHFDVAPDKRRPFTVTAGDMTVTAVGTAFDVLALPGRTGVTLIEGVVHVEARVGDGAVQMMRAGQQIEIEAGKLSRPLVVEMDAALAWQRRLIDLDNVPLGQALDEVNRYSSVMLIVAEPALRETRISGIFKTGDIDAVAVALTGYFGLSIVRRDDHSLVLARPPAASQSGK